MKKNLLENLTKDDLEDLRKLLEFGKRLKDNPRLMYDLGLKIGLIAIERAIERIKEDLKIK